MPEPQTIQLREVPRDLYPSHPWLNTGNNRDALRVWLEKHEVNIATVFNLQFRNDGFTVSQYLMDDKGNKRIEMKLEGRVGRVLTEVTDHEYLPGMLPRLLRGARERT